MKYALISRFVSFCVIFELKVISKLKDFSLYHSITLKILSKPEENTFSPCFSN